MTETQGLRIAVVGATGAVGQQMISTLEQRDLPIKKIIFYHRLVPLESNLRLRAKKSKCRKQNLKALKASISLYSVLEEACLRNWLQKQ